MSVNRANTYYVDQGTPKRVLGLHYMPRSDFINLSKLGMLVIIKKLEEEKGEESQGTLTLQGWIWENMVKVFEILAYETRMDMEVGLEPKGKLKMKIHREKYIMGFTAKNVSVTSTMHDILKSL